MYIKFFELKLDIIILPPVNILRRSEYLSIRSTSEEGHDILRRLTSSSVEDLKDRH